MNKGTTDKFSLFIESNHGFELNPFLVQKSHISLEDVSRCILELDNFCLLHIVFGLNYDHGTY